MPFPEAKRVIYNKNPLDEVISQLKFQPILQIDKEIPADFQDKIRNFFPKYSETPETLVEVPREIRTQVPDEILKNMFPTSGGKNYAFASEDDHWKVNLTRSFVALSTNKYLRWEEFREKIQIVLDALENSYKPSYFTRIGLRYIDIIRRSELKLENENWNFLLNEFVLGVLSSKDIGQHVENFENKYEIRLSDDASIVRVITKFVKYIDNEEIGFMIDSDFYCTERTEIKNAIS